MNDMFVFGFVALASLTSGGMINCSSGDIHEGWPLISMSIFPLTIIAIIALSFLNWNYIKTL